MMPSQLVKLNLIKQVHTSIFTLLSQKDLSDFLDHLLLGQEQLVFIQTIEYHFHYVILEKESYLLRLVVVKLCAWKEQLFTLKETKTLDFIFFMLEETDLMNSLINCLFVFLMAFLLMRAEAFNFLDSHKLVVLVRF